MCGIVGHVAEATADLHFVRDAVQSLAHRGPDGQRTWRSPDTRACLGHARLAIIDLSEGAAQPLADHTGQVVLVFNGEIYNYLELRTRLTADGHRFHTASDSEVLLQSYLAWGEGCLEKLNGMFAFAIWDGRHRKLFAARDRFGEKPFYYHASSSGFRFASEIKALLRAPEVIARADERAMLRYLALAQVDGEETTFFEGIRQLPPGHWLSYSDGDTRIGRYWGLAETEGPQGTDEEFAERFRALFLDSVRLRLRSDVPVGTGLSGGLDSSAVVGAVRSLRGRDAPLQSTFSARYAEGDTDEGTFIDAVVAQGRVRDHHVFLRADQLLPDLPALVWHQEEPFVSLSMYAQFKVMELVRLSGVTVVLDGQGADEFLAGYHPPAFGGRFASLAAQGHWAHAVAEMNAYRRRHGGGMRAFRFLATALLPAPAWTFLKIGNEGARAFLRPGLLSKYFESLIPAEPPAFRSPLKESLRQQLTRISLPSLLRFGDRNSMAFSREARLPFLDHRLVELTMSMPEHLLVSDGTTKVVLRRAMAGYLPTIVAGRMDKLGFATPQDLWFRGPLRRWFESLLTRAARSELLLAPAVRRHWSMFLTGHAALGPLWRIANLQLWRERFAV